MPDPPYLVEANHCCRSNLFTKPRILIDIWKEWTSSFMPKVNSQACFCYDLAPVKIGLHGVIVTYRESRRAGLWRFK